MVLGDNLLDIPPPEDHPSRRGSGVRISTSFQQIPSIVPRDGLFRRGAAVERRSLTAASFDR